MSKSRFGCPGCGSSRVREWSTALISYDVLAREDSGDPEDFSLPTIHEGAGVREEPPYSCRDCDLYFWEPARLPDS